jgi:hypothetical protein
VLVELQQQGIQRVRAVVGVGDRLGAGEGFRFGVKRCMDFMIRAVLPVTRAGTPVGAALAIDGMLVVEWRKQSLWIVFRCNGPACGWRRRRERRGCNEAQREGA